MKKKTKLLLIGTLLITGCEGGNNSISDNQVYKVILYSINEPTQTYYTNSVQYYGTSNHVEFEDDRGNAIHYAGNFKVEIIDKSEMEAK